MPFFNLKFKISNLKLSKGFTLIELLVVIAILATLAGAIIYSTTNTREKGRDAKRKEELKSLASALTLYYADNNKYPITTDGSGNPVLDYSSDSAEPWIPDLEQYLEKLPKDPLQAATGGAANLIKQTTTKLAGIFQNKPETQTTTKPQVAGAVTTTLGETNIGNSLDSTNGNYFHGNKFTTGDSGGIATEMSVYIGSNLDPSKGKYTLAIYTNVVDPIWGDIPGTKIANTNTNTNLIANAWNTQPITATLAPNTKYWLLYNTNTNSTILNIPKNFNLAPGSKEGIVFSANYGTFPAFDKNDVLSRQADTRMSIFLRYNYNESTITGTVANGNDDAVRHKNNNSVNKNGNNLAVGSTTCGDPQEPYIRFTLNKGLIHNVHIDSAKINFNPRNYTDEERAANRGPSPKTRFRAEAALDPTQISDGNNWAGRKKTSSSVIWDSIGTWDPTDPSYYPTNLQSPDISPILQELVDFYASQGISIHIINVFWENTNTDPNSCDGRIPDSDDGGNPPTIDIEVSTPTKPSCSPLTITGALVDTTVNFNANSGDQINYSWTETTGGTVLNNSGNTQNLQIKYSEPGTYNVRVSSGGQQSDPCTVEVVDSSGLPPSDPGGGGTNSFSTACNDKNGVFCYRVSLDKKHFVLWAQLENINDPQIYNSTSGTAVCAETPPSGSLLNYCLKSAE